MATSLTFAIPIEWSSSNTYERNMIVFIGKRAFTAIQDVPTGIEITNENYWIETGVPFLDVQDIYNRLSTVETGIGDLDDDVTQAKRDIVTNANNITSLTTRMSTAENDIDTLDGNVSSLTTRMSTAENDIDTLDGDVAQAKQDITNNASNITSLTTRVSTAEGDIDDLDGDVTQAKQDIIANANNITSLTSRLNTAVTELENEVARVNNIMVTLYTPVSGS